MPIVACFHCHENRILSSHTMASGFIENYGSSQCAGINKPAISSRDESDPQWRFASRNLWHACLLLPPLHLLMGTCPIFYTRSPVTCMSNFRTNVLEAVQLAWEALVSHFLRFLQADHHPFVYTNSPCSSSDSAGPSNVADVLRILFCRVSPMLHHPPFHCS